MSSNQDVMEKRHVFTDCDEKYICKVRRNGHNYRQVYEYDKKMKREIANSNERRRMQSINMGFETLKQLLPMTMEGEKLSKASILQFTAKYIQSLIVRLTTLEKEVASYKKNFLNNKDKMSLSSKSTTVLQTVSVEQNRKRRLNSCTVDFDASQTENPEQNLDIPCNNSFPTPNQDSSSTNCQISDKTPGSLEHLVAAIEQVEGEKFYMDSTTNTIQSKVLKEDINCDSSFTVESNNDSLDLLEDNSKSTSNTKVVLNNSDVKKQSNSFNNNSSSNTGNTNSSMTNSAVMKPTISPYTEKIILAVSQHPHMFENRVPGYGLNITQPTYQIISNDQVMDSAGFSRNFVGSQRMSIPHKYLHRPDVAIQKNRTL